MLRSCAQARGLVQLARWLTALAAKRTQAEASRQMLAVLRRHLELWLDLPPEP